MRTRAAGLLVAALFSLAGTAHAQWHLPPDSLALGRQYVDWLLEGQVDSLHAHMTPEVQQRITPDQITDQSDMIAMRAGVRIDILEEKYVMRNGKPQYWQTATFTEMNEPLVFRFVIEPDGRISGAGINPQSQNPPTDSEKQDGGGQR